MQFPRDEALQCSCDRPFCIISPAHLSNSRFSQDKATQTWRKRLAILSAIQGLLVERYLSNIVLNNEYFELRQYVKIFEFSRKKTTKSSTNGGWRFLVLIAWLKQDKKSCTSSTPNSLIILRNWRSCLSESPTIKILLLLVWIPPALLASLSAHFRDDIFSLLHLQSSFNVWAKCSKLSNTGTPSGLVSSRSKLVKPAGKFLRSIQKDARGLREQSKVPFKSVSSFANKPVSKLRRSVFLPNKSSLIKAREHRLLGRASNDATEYTRKG